MMKPIDRSVNARPGGSGMEFDVAAEASHLVSALREAVHQRLRRQGAVVGISGGVDSAVVLGLCVRAFGPERVVGLMLPERDSSPENERLARSVAGRFGVDPLIEDITAALGGFGCYERRDDAIRRMYPEFGPGWKVKITLPGSLLTQETLNVFHVTVTDPSGRTLSQRLPPREYREIVAASNLKQRTRMAMLYYHAERLHYAVVGTANKNEHALGFFVKHGDGGADVQPIAHLFKTQVYQLARYLDVPVEVLYRTPATDTYSAGGTQEEFFFRVPFEILDPVWAAHEQGVPRHAIAEEMGLTQEQVDRVITDIVRKQRTTEYLREAAITCSQRGAAGTPTRASKDRRNG